MILECLVPILMASTPPCSNVSSTATLELEQADPPSRISRRIKRLTGRPGRARNDFADPSPPDLSEPGVVRVYTTNNFALVWRATQNHSALDRFLRGTPPQVETLNLVDVDGKTPMEGWDIGVQEISHTRILYAGVMTPQVERV